MLRTMLCAAGLVLAVTAQGQVYKWVDDKGQTHYTETPPPQDSKQLKVPTGQPAASAPEEKKEPAAPAKDPKDKAARCDFEKSQLAVLDRGKVIYKDDKGQMVEMDDAKKEKAKALVQDNIKKYCS
jgi:hypothetical protein